MQHQWRDESQRRCKGQCIDWGDLTTKIRLMMDFSARACSYDDYGDSFLVHFVPGGVVANEEGRVTKSIKLLWFCRHLWPTRESLALFPSTDHRRHEDILRQSFSDYQLEIEKLPYHWEVIISSSPSSVHPHEPPRKKVCAMPTAAAATTAATTTTTTTMT